MRKETLFNDNWLFHLGDIREDMPRCKGPVYAQSKTMRKKSGPASVGYPDNPDPYGAAGEIKDDGWEFVTLPHDYIIGQDNSADENNALGYFHYFNAWYRKHFTLTHEYSDKRITLRFEGVATSCTVYLNGCILKRNFSAYNTFEVDITDYVLFDKDNVISLYVSTEDFEGWWYQGGGIYRDVYLTVTEQVAIDLYGVYAPAERIKGELWRVNFRTCVLNTSYEKVLVEAVSTLIDRDGNKVAAAFGKVDIAPRESSVIVYAADVTNPELWDTERPYLYTVETVLSAEGKEIDKTFARIGFRTVEITPEGFFLNGKKTVIKGVCAHQDFGLTGIAVSENIAKYKMSLIKDMGANAYRAVHYQQTKYYLDACDESGILVMDENRWFESTDKEKLEIESLVKRDRNRPSVIFWSTSNEEPFHITENGRRIQKSLAEHIRRFDNTRFITAAVSESPDKCTMYDECDVIGINYNLYLYEDVHSAHPDKMIFSSENCATGTTRGWHYPSNSCGRLRDADTDVTKWFVAREKTWKFLMSKPYVIGGFQWAAVEHRGEAAWPAVCSKSGALDLFLQKKGAFYQNKSFWTDDPMIYIVPHWNFAGMEGEPIDVAVYTNCEEAELFLGNESLGRQKIEKFGHGFWQVPYKAGTLAAKGYNDGKVVAEDERKTSGAPKRLKLRQLNRIEPDGRDIALFLCECEDGHGVTVPDAEEFVEFSVSAPAVIIGTGSDNCDHGSVKNTSRKMYMGKILVAVKPQEGQSEFELLASSKDCGRSVLKVNL